jgi:ketosteroid isomerase-like protein
MASQTDEDAVIEANAVFYRAFESLEPDEMEAIWAAEEPIRCVHPGWALITGREAVLESWERIMDNASVMQFTVIEPAATVVGDWAWVVCGERLTSVQGGRVAEGLVQATNMFHREGGRWLIAHHHGSPVMGL